MEMAQALKPLGVRPITGAELTLDDGPHLTLLCETREGYRNLCRLITAAHWPHALGARGLVEPVAQVTDGRARPRIRSTASRADAGDVERHAEGLVCLSGCARDGAVAARIERGDHPRGRGGGPAPAAPPSGPTASASSSSARYCAPRPPPQPLLAELAERLGVPCVATGNVHVHSRERTAAPGRDGRGAARRDARRDRAQRRGNSSHVLTPPERMAERFRDHPEAVAESGRLAERLDVRPHRGPRLPLPRLGGPRRRPQAGRAVPGTARRALPGRRRGRPGPARGGAARDPPPGPVGLLPAAPRHARAGARGRARGARAGVGAAAAAARPRARLERVVDRLLPHRPLARRPDRERAAAWGASSTRS